MNKMCGLQNSDGVQAVAEVDMPKFANLSDANTTSLQRLLVLERLQDPGNLGTLLRTAVALGWDACFLLPGCCDPFNDKALKAGRGAAFKLPTAKGKWDELLHVMHRHDMQCYGASPERSDTAAFAQQLEAKHAVLARQLSDLPQSSTKEAQDEVVGSNAMCIVLGSEGQGLSKTALEHSTPLAIPMTDRMESLNVSQAGAILMFAFCGNSLKLYDQVKRPH
ncbi:MAG: putative tRNA rRNA methyltransferase slr1673-like [Trebouxia sp. A1-2]|nr:MAG: putative tRNA rRNA methyltransferase slr1673-like [Trebouxia sp. A1-2]